MVSNSSLETITHNSPLRHFLIALLGILIALLGILIALLGIGGCSEPADAGRAELTHGSADTNGGSMADGEQAASDLQGDDPPGGEQFFVTDEDEPKMSDEPEGPEPPMGDPVTSGVDTQCGSNLVGLVRDFHDTHPDMEVCDPAKGAMIKQCVHEKGIIEDELGPDDKPVYAGDPESGTDTTTGKQAFDQWFRNVDGINTAVPFTLNFSESMQNGIKTFVFDSKNPPEGSPEGFYPGPDNNPPGGFFPIDELDQDGFRMQSKLYPGSQKYPHNYHFTFEFVTDFVYNGGEVFTFTGDDDVFVFINRQLVVDLGGIHVKLEGKVELDRQAERLGLERGETYPVHLFFAERHVTESNFRIETTLVFTSCNLPQVK